MNARTELLTQTMKPTVAIMVYRGEDKVSGYGQYYLESHGIDESGKILEGKPLQQETIEAMVDVFFDERQNRAEVTGIIPPNVLWFQLLPGGHYKMVWYRPAEIRVMHHASQLKLPTAKAWVPAMIYVTDRNGLDVYALATDERPKETTRLYKAPFYNVNDGADVCLGNAKVQKPKEKTYSNLMKYWEDLFWLSEFSHVNGSEKVKSGSLNAVWRKLLGKRPTKKWSDLDELIAHGNKTVKSLL